MIVTLTSSNRGLYSQWISFNGYPVREMMAYSKGISILDGKSIKVLPIQTAFIAIKSSKTW